MKSIYLGEWDNFEQMVSDFIEDAWEDGAVSNAIASDDFSGIHVLLAYYEVDGYEGDAFVIYKKNGKLYEVNGSHCSCYGLERQWEPSEVTYEELIKRMDDGNLGCDYNGHDKFAKELRKVVESEMAS